jgi:16S rRNA (cytidine1402-2'-O)-methyltransferase
MTVQHGILYLIPTPLGECELQQCLPVYNIELLNSVDIFIVEELRTARRFLRKAGIQKRIDEITFLELNEHTETIETKHYLDEAFHGKNIGLLSEAGIPCVADPGSVIVKLAHESGIQVKPLNGPSSIMLALMASGLNGQQFIFHGYLPVKVDQRKKALRILEQDALQTGKTHIFIETPYRNNAMLQTIVDTCHPDTKLSIAADLTLETEFIRTATTSKWKKNTPDLNKRPAVFLIGI